MKRSSSYRLRQTGFGSCASLGTTTSTVLAFIVVLSAAPALGQPIGATMTCEPSSQTACPGTTVTLDLLLVERAEDVRGYQTTIQITRTSGTGTVTVSPCPGAVAVDEDRPDFIFPGFDSEDLEPDCTDCGIVVPYCEGQQVAVARVTEGVDVGATPVYLATYTLEVSSDATPGSTFEISIVPFPASILGASDKTPIPFEIGPSCELTIEEGIPTVSEWALIVLALLLLTGIKITFGRRTRKTTGSGASLLPALVLALALGNAAFAAEVCQSDADCDDGDVCTLDRCIDSSCSNIPVANADMAAIDGCNPDGAVDEFDIYAIADGFAGALGEGCSPHNMDLHSSSGCEPDGAVDLFDILTALDAFAGTPNCPCETMPECRIRIIFPDDGTDICGCLWEFVVAQNSVCPAAEDVAYVLLEYSVDGENWTDIGISSPLLEGEPDWLSGLWTVRWDTGLVEYGVYLVRATIVFVDEGMVMSDPISVYVGRAPVAQLTFAPGEGPGAVLFDGSTSFDEDGVIVSWTWHFGDGDSVIGEDWVVEHVYEDLTAAYDVMLCVEDDAEKQDCDYFEIAFTEGGIATGGPTQKCICESMTIHSSDKALGPKGDSKKKWKPKYKCRNDGETLGPLKDNPGNKDVCKKKKEKLWTGYAFEVEAVVQGNPKKCKEIQLVRASFVAKGIRTKQACEKAHGVWANNVCTIPHRWVGTTPFDLDLDGETDIDASTRDGCEDAGGTWIPDINRKTEGNQPGCELKFPQKPDGKYGSDNYTKEWTRKKYVGNRILWYDVPGFPSGRAAWKYPNGSTMKADFVMIVRGTDDKYCYCKPSISLLKKKGEDEESLTPEDGGCKKDQVSVPGVP